MIFVTGASGNVGAALVHCLRERNLAFRIGARSALDADDERVKFDFFDASTFAPAVAGCSAVFLMRPPQIANTRATLNRFIDVARAAGVRHIVFLSVVGADTNALLPHHAVERRLRRRHSGWTILQPGFFAQNFGDAYRSDIVRDDRVFVPAAHGRVAFVDVRDIAAVAVEALLDPSSHSGQTYALTGGEAISFAQAAQVLSAELQRPIRYEPAAMLAYYLHLRRRGIKRRQALVQTILHTGLRFGHAERVDPTLARLLGRAPRTLRDYVRDHRELWNKQSSH